MPFEVVMPRLGWNMEKGILVKWHKQDGERVVAGEVLFTVEADKANQEVEALEGGILRIPSGSPALGSEVPVGTLLGYLLQPGEAEPGQAGRPAAPPASPASPAGTPGDRWTPGDGELPLRRPAGGPVRAPGEAPAISPRARRVARELAVAWESLAGSGSTGRIVERDVRQAAARPDLASSASAAGRAVATSGVGLLPPTRRLIAERMAASAHTAAAVTLTTEVDATELVRLRRQIAADPGRLAPSYNDLLAKVAAQALVEHPALNARLEGGAIVQPGTVNVGLAVDTERGLLVPVLRDVQAKPLAQIALESAALIEAARAGRIDASDLRGGTFTLTNLGMYDIDAFTPIINLPECAVLGVGRITPKQVVMDADADRVAIRHMMFLSLTFDHRLVDGAPAARFLRRVKQYIEEPYLWLVSQTPAAASSVQRPI